MFGCTYAVWLVVVDVTLRGHTGRGLEYLPADVPDAWLRCWWRAGVPARVVGGALSTKITPVRVTFVGEFGDRPCERFMQMRSVS